MQEIRLATKDRTISNAIKAVALICLVFVLCMFLLTYNLPGPRLQRVAMALVGQSEAKVLEQLGPPKHVARAADLKGRTVDYPWKNMNFVPLPTRPITNKAMLYSEMGFAVYIYIDRSGQVEHVHKAAT